MNEEKRDLAKDLELCGAVMPDIAEHIAVLVGADVPEDMAAKYFAFLDQVREGWPAAIRRAMAAEQALELNAALLARQTDLAREAEIWAMLAEGELRRLNSEARGMLEAHGYWRQNFESTPAFGIIAQFGALVEKLKTAEALAAIRQGQPETAVDNTVHLLTEGE